MPCVVEEETVDRLLLYYKVAEGCELCFLVVHYFLDDTEITERDLASLEWGKGEEDMQKEACSNPS